MASPRVYPGQTIQGRISGSGYANLYVAATARTTKWLSAVVNHAANGFRCRFQYAGTDVQPVFEIGVELAGGDVVFLGLPVMVG